jgi:hypothetical protein
MNSCASHLTEVLQPEMRGRIVRRITKEIRESKLEYEAIAFKGLSGALVVPAVATRLKKPIIAVRSDMKCHSEHQIEGLYLPTTSGRYIIVDDFIFDGNTIREIHRQITYHQYKDSHTAVPKCVGVFCYHGGSCLFVPPEVKVADGMYVKLFKFEATKLP